MKKTITLEVLSFLKNLPNMPCSKEQKGTFTEEDEARIKVMLNNSTDAKSQADRAALRQYILNVEFQDNVEITDADRKAMVEYMRQCAPEFYKSLLKPTS